MRYRECPVFGVFAVLRSRTGHCGTRRTGGSPTDRNRFPRPVILSVRRSDKLPDRPAPALPPGAKAKKVFGPGRGASVRADDVTPPRGRKRRISVIYRRTVGQWPATRFADISIIILLISIINYIISDDIAYGYFRNTRAPPDCPTTRRGFRGPTANEIASGIDFFFSKSIDCNLYYRRIRSVHRLEDGIPVTSKLHRYI